MNKDDLDYYRTRVAEEQKAADRASHATAAESHRRLAEQYAGILATLEGAASRDESSR